MIIVVVEKKQWSPPTDILPDIPIYYELYINLAFYLTYKKTDILSGMRPGPGVLHWGRSR